MSFTAIHTPLSCNNYSSTCNLLTIALYYYESLPGSGDLAPAIVLYDSKEHNFQNFICNLH
jgi:hypothetical protein